MLGQSVRAFLLLGAVGLTMATHVAAEEAVLNFGITYTGEWADIEGGAQNGDTYLDNVDIILEGDLEQLFGWKNSRFSAYVLGNQGGSPSAYAGDLQTVSNIDAPDTWKLYELWYQRSWREGAHSVRIGLYDYNSEFDVIEAGGLFLNSSHGIGPDISQSGKNGPSIFPTTSLAIRAFLSNDNGYYFQSLVMDGVPGDVDEPHGTQVHLDGEDGLMIAAEAGFTSEVGGFSKFALGTWRYTRDIEEDVSGVAIDAQDNWGVYGLVEGQLFSEGDDTQGLTAFLRYGIADKEINPLGSYLGAGVVYTGLFPSRTKDQFGVAIANAYTTGPYRTQLEIGGERSRGRESTLELTYRAGLTPWLTVQPGFQYVIDPGAVGSTDDARVFLFRFEIALNKPISLR